MKSAYHIIWHTPFYVMEMLEYIYNSIMGTACYQNRLSVLLNNEVLLMGKGVRDDLAVITIANC